MSIRRPIYEGSEVLAALAMRTHALFGDRPLERSDISAIILEVERCTYTGDRLRLHLDEGIASLVRCGVLQAMGEQFALTPRALAFAAARFAEIEREIERLAATFDAHVTRSPADAPAPSPGAAAANPSWDLDRTSRTFLQDMLRGADIPADLVDLVVTTYAETGRIQMSEDGTRYVIHLPPTES